MINLDKIPHDRVAYGSRVLLYDYAAEKEVRYTLVSPEESDLTQGLISISSPIGRSLLGKSVGEEVTIITPSGQKDYEIRSLATIHDIEE
jgi:transcription elongation factor GreA